MFPYERNALFLQLICENYNWDAMGEQKVSKNSIISISLKSSPLRKKCASDKSRNADGEIIRSVLRTMYSNYDYKRQAYSEKQLLYRRSSSSN